MGGALRKAMIAAIRQNRERLRTVYDRCADATLQHPPAVAIGPRGGCLVTPRHALHAWHYRLTVGDTVRYQWGHRTVASVSQVGQTDLAVATLDEPAPESVRVAAVLPHDWALDLRTIRGGGLLRRPIVAHGIGADGRLHRVEARSVCPTWAAPGPWQRGDSGQPLWLPLEQPILLGCHHYAGYGPSPAHYWRELAMLGAGVEEGETWSR